MATHSVLKSRWMAAVSALVAIGVLLVACSRTIEPQVSPASTSPEDTAPVSTAPPADTTPPTVAADPPTVPLSEYIGKSEGETTGILEEQGFSVRVVERDGEKFIVTFDYRIDRVNLVVNDGVVADAYIG